MNIKRDSDAEAFVASCQALGIFSQGDSEAEAEAALMEANQMIVDRLA